MTPLDDLRRLQLAAFIAGCSVVEFQMRLVEMGFAAALGAEPSKLHLRLASDLHGIAVDPEFIKDKPPCVS